MGQAIIAPSAWQRAGIAFNMGLWLRISPIVPVIDVQLPLAWCPRAGVEREILFIDNSHNNTLTDITVTTTHGHGYGCHPEASRGSWGTKLECELVRVPQLPETPLTSLPAPNRAARNRAGESGDPSRRIQSKVPAKPEGFDGPFRLVKATESRKKVLMHIRSCKDVGLSLVHKDPVTLRFLEETRNSPMEGR